MISSSGIGSGINVNSIINQLVALERQPINRLEQKKDDYEAQLSAYGKLKSDLSTFRSAMADLDTPDDFKIYKASSSDSEYFTATASSSANIGTYDITIENLAEAHKMGSASFADKDTTTVGSAGDTMTVTVGSDSLEIDIGGKTLEEVRDAVNEAVSAAAADSDDTNDVAVTASIVMEDESNYYLTLTSQETGTDNEMSLSFADSGGGAITDPLTMGTTKAAEDAQITVDGTYTVTRASNTITDAVEGVTLNLLQADTENTYTLNIERDIEGVEEKAQAFVDAYNSLNQTITDLRAGDLAGDNSLLSLRRRLLNTLNESPSGLNSTYSYLSEVGVSIQKDGTMTLDSDQLKLKDALETDFNGVAQLFGNDDQGYAYRLKELADEFLQLGGNGVIETREDGLNDRIDAVEQRIDSMERRLVITEDRLRDQFTALDSLVGQLQATGNFLSQQLAGLAGV